jgi:hypothetical protein
MNTVYENSQKEKPKEFRGLIKLEEKIFVQDACHFIKKIPTFILKNK